MFYVGDAYSNRSGPDKYMNNYRLNSYFSYS